MIPKVVSDAGYTVVGLGVLAVQQVQTRRRETRSRVSSQLAATRQSVESAVERVKTRIEPLQARIEPLVEKLEPLQAKLEPVKAKLERPLATALDRLPHLPGAIGGLVDSGRDRLQSALRSDDEPPARHAKQGKVKAPKAPADSTD